MSKEMMEEGLPMRLIKGSKQKIDLLRSIKASSSKKHENSSSVLSSFFCPIVHSTENNHHSTKMRISQGITCAVFSEPSQNE
jgi:hypothetical protein